MKSFKYLGLALAATTLLGAAPVLADETNVNNPESAPAEIDKKDASGETNHKVGESKDTKTQVKIVETDKVVDPENPDKDGDGKITDDEKAILTFKEAPTRFYFETKTLGTDQYELKADASTKFGEEKAITGEYKVHSDAIGAHYKVTAKIDTVLKSGEKTVNVTNFQINNGANIREKESVVMDHTMAGLDYNTASGDRIKKVDNIQINFTAAEGTEVKPGDVYSGNITNTLYNAYVGDEA